MRIYYAKKNTPLYFLNIVDEEEEVNKLKLDLKHKWCPINSPGLQIVLLFSVREFSWGNTEFINKRKGFYIFKHLPSDNLFGIYGDRLKSEEQIKTSLFDIYMPRFDLG